MKRSLPNLISVTTIAEDGSRRFLHPADVSGRFTFWKKLAALLLLAVYILLPWIPVNGYPAVFLDVAARHFHFFGLTLAMHDLWLGFFIITGLAFSLFYITSFFGRIWCGWTCPYTVFLEHVYRRVERWIEGDATARRQLEDAPWTAGKIFKRVLKHGIFLILSALIAHIFLSYFVSLKQLYVWMQGPPSQHVFAFGAVLFITGGLYFAFSWFREQFCIILCPYGRLQSTLIDDNTVVIGYDKIRGEPRGKVTDLNAGDCINCSRCVQVCPTGIDIRNGLQLECIGCAACVDACDDIMKKVGRPKGLVRYDSLNGLEGKKTRYFRPRTIFYSVLMLLGVVAFSFALSTLKPVRLSAARLSGAPYFVNDGTVRNQFQLRIMNNRNETTHYTLGLVSDAAHPMRLDGGEVDLELPALAEIEKTVVLSLPHDDYKGPFRFRLTVKETRAKGREASREMEFLGPDPRLHNDDYLNPNLYRK
jgi:cytochrome c oxidase accessory protein FixG